MCKLLVAIADNPAQSAELHGLIAAQEASMSDQHNGIGAAVVDTKNRVHVFRALQKKEYPLVFAQVREMLPHARVVSIHTRTSTGGTVSLDNVHFFGADGYVFAHNGFVPKYAQWGGWGYSAPIAGFKFQPASGQYRWDAAQAALAYESEGNGLMAADPACAWCARAKAGICRRHRRQITRQSFSAACDSLKFLKSLPKPATVQGIAGHVKETQFTGMGVLIHEQTGAVHLIVHKQVQAITGKGWSAFFSYNPVVSYRHDTALTAHGVKISVQQQRALVSRPVGVAEMGVYAITP